MKKDIHKLADYLVEVTREGIPLEEKVLAWKLAVVKDQAQELVLKAKECLPSR